MSIRKVGIVLLFALSCLLSEQTAPAQEAGERDLSRYEAGGKFTLRYMYGGAPEDEAEVLARARKLLWAQWRAKRLAHFSIVKIYTHGDSTTINYYVEPGEEARWRVAVEYVSDCCSNDVMMGKARVISVTRVESYYIVSRLDAVSGRAVPEGEKRRPETYTLLLYEGKPDRKDGFVPNRSEVL
jgi:hypothetical protein